MSNVSEGRSPKILFSRFQAVIVPERAAEALDDYRALRLVRHDHAVLLDRVWALRHNLTAYDALYVALAEALDAPLVTTDSRLASAPGHHARVMVCGD